MYWNTLIVLVNLRRLLWKVFNSQSEVEVCTLELIPSADLAFPPGEFGLGNVMGDHYGTSICIFDLLNRSPVYTNLNINKGSASYASIPINTDIRCIASQ